MALDDAIAKLARQIDAARQSERFLVNGDEVARLRRQGACRLHQICADFVASLNSKLTQAVIEDRACQLCSRDISRAGR